jgi:hypothetical protein
MENFLGRDGFVWWIGVVEDIDDPLKLGRCKVRIFGYHSSYSAGDTSTENLPWAVAIHPLNTPNLYGAPKLGSFVFGFFLDSTAAQEPAILGYFPSIPQKTNDSTEDYFGKTPTDFTRSFANVTQTDSVVLDINGAKIEISNTGNVSIVSTEDLNITSNGNVSIVSTGTLTLKDETNTYTLSDIKTGLDEGLVFPVPPE